MGRRLLLSLLLLLLAAEPALAQLRIGVRVGDHAGYGRVVFDWPSETGYRVEEQDGRVVLRFARAAEFDLPASGRLARNLRAFCCALDDGCCGRGRRAAAWAATRWPYPGPVDRDSADVCAHPWANRYYSCC